MQPLNPQAPGAGSRPMGGPPHPRGRSAFLPAAPRPHLGPGLEDSVLRAALPSRGSAVALADSTLPSSKTGAEQRAPGGSCAKLAEVDLGPAQVEEEDVKSFVTRQEFLAVEQQLEAVREELKCLKWKVRHLGETVQPLAEESKRYNGYTLLELKAMVQCEKDPCRAAHKILAALFSDVDLLQQQPAGTELACNAKTLPQPQMDPELYTVYCEILQSLFPGGSSQALPPEPKGVP